MDFDEFETAEFESATKSIEGLASAQLSMNFVKRAFVSRGGVLQSSTQILVPLRLLLPSIDKNARVLHALRLAINTNMALFSLYHVVLSLRKMEERRQLALAAAETAARATPATAWMIPLAIAGTATAMASFKIGSAIRSGSWNFGSRDITNPADRRRASADLRGVSS